MEAKAWRSANKFSPIELTKIKFGTRKTKAQISEINVRAGINSRSQNFSQNNILSNRVGRNGGFGGLTTGQIISKDINSITISAQSGGSKIIFLDSNTKVLKQTAGTLSELAVGTEVSITGVSNADGSVSAQSVQIRPNTSPVLK